jgi:type II secretory pathway pseudopilin PulG
MRALFKNQKGISLVELLAVLALLSMVIMLISSTHLFGQKQFSSQSDQIQHEANVRYVMNVITKEVRTAPTDKITITNNKIKTQNGEFRLQGNRFYRDDIVIEEGIAEFTIKRTGNEITIKIKSEPNEFNKTASLSTNLYIRE